MTTPTERFAELVGRDEAEIPLDEAALLLAAHAQPDLDVAAELARVDGLAATCPQPTLAALRQHLFDDLGFAGNTRRYGDPRNSFLNEVMTRRVGIPISLSVLTMEVGRRLGLELAGIGMPGQFLVHHQDDQGGRYLDPFDGGRELTVDDCARLFRRLHGAGSAFGSHLLPPVGPRAILVRMLANLRQTYVALGDARSVGWVHRLRATIPAESAADQADVARALASLGRFGEAAARLDALAASAPQGAERVRAEAHNLRARLN